VGIEDKDAERHQQLAAERHQRPGEVILTAAQRLTRQLSQTTLEGSRVLKRVEEPLRGASFSRRSASRSSEPADQTTTLRR
jgi:hypothetical protein